MKFVKDLNILDFFNLINHTVHFTSDCDFFPNFDVKCKVLTIAYNGIIEVSTGTTIKKIIRKLKNFLPGNLNLAIAYPAKPFINIFNTITIDAYTKLLITYFHTEC